MLSFYRNLLLKLSLTQSILITKFTSWIHCLWGGVPCQHIPPSVSGISASLFAACWEKWLPFLPWCSVSNPPLSLVSFRTPCSWDNLRRRSIVTRDTCSDEYWSADEISSESRQNCCFWNTVSTAKARCSTDQRSMATEMLWVSLEERSRTNPPHQRFHSQLFCKIVRYFCRTLYMRTNGQAGQRTKCLILLYQRQRSYGD